MRFSMVSDNARAGMQQAPARSLFNALGFTPEEMKKPDLFALVHIKEDLQELFGKSVDIVRLRKNMNPMLLSRIQRDGIYA